MREEVVLAETDPLGGLIHSVVGYVSIEQCGHIRKVMYLGQLRCSASKDLS
jgi:hypothetical protein